MIFEAFDVVIVPFPFTDRSAEKRRPALVLSDSEAFNRSAGHLVLAMITSAQNSRWPLDVPIAEPAAAGLSSPSIVRMKLFTLDTRLILRKAGALGLGDRKTVAAALEGLFKIVLV